LCVLASQEKKEEITDLTDDPTVICFICGRNATLRETLPSVVDPAVVPGRAAVPDEAVATPI